MKREKTDPNDILSSLDDTLLRRYLSPADLQSLLQNSAVYSFSAEEVVIAENEFDQNLYIILEGNVSVQVETNGRNIYITTLGPGEIFGESGLFGNAPRTASIIAQEEVRLLMINRKGFLQSINAAPKAAVKFLFMIVYGLLTKLRGVNAELAYERKDDVDQSDIDAMLSGITSD